MQSLSEIDTTSKRASKAAGFSWGIAEEIGKSIRSLELFGLPGIINLNLYLKKIKKNHPEKLNKIDLLKFVRKLVLLNFTNIFFPKISEALLTKGNINKG